MDATISRERIRYGGQVIDMRDREPIALDNGSCATAAEAEEMFRAEWLRIAAIPMAVDLYEIVETHWADGSYTTEVEIIKRIGN